MVYEHYFEQWWLNWQSRLGRIQLTQEEIEATKSMAEKDGFVSHGFNYIESCAIALTQAQLAIAQDSIDFLQRNPVVYQTFFLFRYKDSATPVSFAVTTRWTETIPVST